MRWLRNIIVNIIADGVYNGLRSYQAQQRLTVVQALRIWSTKWPDPPKPPKEVKTPSNETGCD